MRPITLTVDAPPPIRHHDGVYADRSSPNAMPLFEAAAAVVAADPDAFPIRHPVGLVITSSEPLPDTWPEHGSDAAIIEVLVDARLPDDESLGETVREEITPGMRGYSINRRVPCQGLADWRRLIPLTVDGVTELRLSVPEAGRRLLPLPIAAWHATVGRQVGRNVTDAKGATLAHRPED
jgi:hypothetical protein